MDITTLSQEEKLALLRELINDFDVEVTATYGESEYISGNALVMGEGNHLYIQTGICTG